MMNPSRPLRIHKYNSCNLKPFQADLTRLLKVSYNTSWCRHHFTLTSSILSAVYITSLHHSSVYTIICSWINTFNTCIIPLLFVILSVQKQVVLYVGPLATCITTSINPILHVVPAHWPRATSARVTVWGLKVCTAWQPPSFSSVWMRRTVTNSVQHHLCFIATHFRGCLLLASSQTNQLCSDLFTLCLSTNVLCKLYLPEM